MKKNLIALGALLVLGVIVFLVFRDKPTEKDPSLTSIQAVDKASLDTIRIKRVDEEGSEPRDENITLKKDGDTWKMTEPVTYKVVDSSVRRMVDTLVDLKAVDVISEDPESHERFEVDGKNGVEITALGGDQTLVHLILGKSRSGMTFARIPKKNPVIRLQGYHQNTFDKSADSLRNKLIIKRDLDEVSKVTFDNPKESLAFEYTGEGEERQLVPVGKQIKNFDEDKAAGLVRSLSSFSTSEFVDEPLPEEETGLGEGATKISIELVEGSKEKNVTMFIGKELQESKDVYVKSTESDQLFLVAASKLERFKVNSDDFARTDEQVKEDKERQNQAAQRPPPGMGGMGGMGGMAGNQQIPPEVMRKIQAQMAQQKPGS